MTKPVVWTFFYGSFINLDVLKQVDLIPKESEVARLNGYDIVIRPLANLVEADDRCVFGMVATATSGELMRLYGQDWVAGLYFPNPVIVQTNDGKWRPALCYIATALEPELASNKYIDRIVGPAKEYGFPEWYIERLESFRP